MAIRAVHGKEHGAGNLTAFGFFQDLRQHINNFLIGCLTHVISLCVQAQFSEPTA
jgi:hypothetical protein